MQRTKTAPSIFAVIAIVFLGAQMPVSCASTGNFMPLENGETILGVIQTNFVARDTINGRDAINTLAYIKLLEAAQEQYARDGVQIDIRDIVWTSITYDGEIFEIRESPPRHGNTLIFRGQGSPCGLLQPDDP